MSERDDVQPVEACPTCGEAIAAGDVFCESCGAELDPVGRCRRIGGPLMTVPDDDAVAGATTCDGGGRPTEGRAATVCPSCGGDQFADGFCSTCGTKRPTWRDHFTEAPTDDVAGVCDKGVGRNRNEDAMAMAVVGDAGRARRVRRRHDGPGQRPGQPGRLPAPRETLLASCADCARRALRPPWPTGASSSSAPARRPTRRPWRWPGRSATRPSRRRARSSPRGRRPGRLADRGLVRRLAGLLAARRRRGAAADDRPLPRHRDDQHGRTPRGGRGRADVAHHHPLARRRQRQPDARDRVGRASLARAGSWCAATACGTTSARRTSWPTFIRASRLTEPGRWRRRRAGRPGQRRRRPRQHHRRAGPHRRRPGLTPIPMATPDRDGSDRWPTSPPACSRTSTWPTGRPTCTPSCP